MAVKTHPDVLSDLAKRLTDLVDRNEDYVVDTRRTGFYVEPKATEEGEPMPSLVKLTIDSEDGDLEFAVNEHAEDQMAGRMRIPRTYWDRMRDDHPDILQDTVQKLMVREPKSRLVRTVDDTARAWLSDRYRRLDNYDLMAQSIAPALMKSGDEKIVPLSYALTDTRMYLKLLFPEIAFKNPRHPSKPLHGGIIVGNSEVGAGSLFVEPFMYDGYCLNGMIFGKQAFADFGLRKAHLGRAIGDDDAARAMFSAETMSKDDEAFFAKAHDLVLNSIKGIQFEAIHKAILEACGIAVPADNLPETVKKLGKSNGLVEGEQNALMKHLAEGGDLSAWGWVSAITRMAQDSEKYDRQVGLERLGGELLAKPTTLVRIAAVAKAEAASA